MKKYEIYIKAEQVRTQQNVDEPVDYFVESVMGNFWGHNIVWLIGKILHEEKSWDIHNFVKFDSSFF